MWKCGTQKNHELLHFELESAVVYYEDLVASPAKYVREIGQLIGVEDLNYVPEEVGYRKQANELNAKFKAELLKEFSLKN